MFTDRSVKAQRQGILACLFVILLGVWTHYQPPRNGFIVQYWPAVLYLLVLGIRFLLLRSWEGKNGVYEITDERTSSVARQAGQYSFWFLMYFAFFATVFFSRHGMGLIPGMYFVIGLVTYTFMELKLRKDVSNRE